MATDRPGPQGPPPDRHDDEQGPVRIHTCARIGMQANPPRARLNWLRRR